MKYIIDNDLHIHSKLSLCSQDEEQTTARILDYARLNSLKTVCITDHFWDETVKGASEWYAEQDFRHISEALPLPQDEGTEFLFGCETELDKNFKLGISEKTFDKFDFVIIPTTHLHMRGFATEDAELDARARAELWIKRFCAVLDMQLPFYKIGIAHLTCKLINRASREEYIKTLKLLPSDVLSKLFEKASALGCGIELNSSDMSFSDDEAEAVLRMYRIAKACGCKFYLGSDAHHPDALCRAPQIFERAVSLLGLTEEDKFHIKKR